ncbi:MAG: hypothetical protein R6U32_01875, partial [Candidatus Woesearchaeota archaeon]
PRTISPTSAGTGYSPLESMAGSREANQENPPSNNGTADSALEICSGSQLMPYVLNVINALTDPSAYDTPFRNNGEMKKGCTSICREAERSLKQQGFSAYSAGWISHPFHWLMVDNGFVKAQWPSVRDNNREGSIFFTPTEKMHMVTAYEMAEMFMERYEDSFLSRLQRIREHPEHRPY